MRFVLAALLLALAEPSLACDGPGFIPSEEAHLQPLSISPTDIGAALTASSFSHGIQFVSKLQDRELHLSVTHVPAAMPEVGPIRAIMQLGRLVDDGFDQLVLVNHGRKLFVISEPELRDIGCRFVWPGKSSSDPILLLRETVQAIHGYDTDEPINNQPSGAPLLDGAHALRLIGETLNPAWLPTEQDPGEAVEEPDAPKNHDDGPPSFVQASLPHPLAGHLDQRF